METDPEGERRVEKAPYEPPTITDRGSLTEQTHGLMTSTMDDNPSLQFQTMISV